MSKITITNNEVKVIPLWEPTFENVTLENYTGAETWAKGTVLGRVTADDHLREYATGNGDGSEVPVAVLTEEIVWAAAGEQPFRVMYAGKVRKNDLVAHGVGAITEAESDQLRNVGIIPLATTELSELDNQ